ncbi:signal recognition particle-docking protein FtsY [Bdellovibrio bacteriovorus]|uniref:signal recognition particle-docking protein FtsY n=1 Tax=Bdellovibrio bacteriovorus TaxID=959 RepID=UPI0021D181B6|nr:signal recognition particle-docking protein FtsY [Bdellovibrio bacteriovorus]UXR65093.1 signal recognition particle-docking protein FtsY [Bdellovibrio bacteriovorus]
MMSPGHEQQITILAGLVVLIFVVIFGALIISMVRSSKKKAQELTHETKREIPTTAEVEETEGVRLAHIDSTGNVVSDLSVPDLHDAAVALEEKAVDLRDALRKTEENLFGRIRSLFKGETSNKHLEEIEEILYTSDLGPTTVQRLMGAIEDKLSKKERADYDTVREALKEEIKNIFSDSASATVQGGILSKIKFASEGPTVLMIVGVNGAGKTTSIGKISAQLAGEGKKVLVAAGDTFRAAAGGQLKVWTDRAQVEIFSPEGVTDPSAVAFDAVAKGKAQGYDVVIVDTAGRLHTQANLMEEIKKMKRVMTKVIPDAPHETLIVLDANSGQNALMQAKEFHNALGLTGAVLTKMDGTAKGGVAVGLAQELHIPIKLIGVGERIQDLRTFSSQEFVESLFH